MTENKKTTTIQPPNFKEEAENLFKKIDSGNYKYFLKGDISGIQDFIFSVKSEKAAKTLKARSYFIQALADICIQFISDELNGDIVVLANGGGNFYLFTKEEIIDKLPKIQNLIHDACHEEEFHVTLTVQEIEDVKNQFGKKIWKPLQKKSASDKLIKFEGYSNVFEAYSYQPLTHQEWDVFTPNFIRLKSKEIIKKQSQALIVKHNEINVLNYVVKISKKENGINPYQNKIINKIPRWSKELIEKYKAHSDNKEDGEIKDGDVIEFHELAMFAKDRTGTSKLGVLALDIDGLGKLFDGIENILDLTQISLAMSWFFEEHMLNIWDNTFDWREKTDQGYKVRNGLFKENIYMVFSGGDDCFLLGAWDAVFEFAQRLQKDFEIFAKQLKKEIHSVDSDLTFSAGLVVVDSHFPIVRFAKIAQDALYKAKSVKDKNRITVFGQTIKWSEFSKAKNVSNQLCELIQEKGESRAILERFKRSSIGFEKIQEDAVKGRLRAPKVSRLFYYLRNVKKENLPTVNKLINEYAEALIEAFDKKKTMHQMTFPVGARWAEFLTRKGN